MDLCNINLQDWTEQDFPNALGKNKIRLNLKKKKILLMVLIS